MGVCVFNGAFLHVNISRFRCVFILFKGAAALHLFNYMKLIRANIVNKVVSVYLTIPLIFLYPLMYPCPLEFFWFYLLLFQPFHKGLCFSGHVFVLCDNLQKLGVKRWHSGLRFFHCCEGLRSVSFGHSCSLLLRGTHIAVFSLCNIIKYQLNTRQFVPQGSLKASYKLVQHNEESLHH